MQYSNFVGRVGALAVALGVGTAIATPAGIAWASPEPAGDSTTAATQDTASGAPAAGSSPSATDTAAPSTVDAGPQTPTSPETTGTTGTPTPTPTAGSATTVDVAPGVIVSHSGGAQTSTYGSNPTEPTGKNKPRHDDGDTAPRDTAPVATVGGPTATSSSATEPKSSATPATSAQTPSTATTAPAAQVPSSTTIAPVSLTPTPPAAAVTVAPLQNVVSTVLSNVVAPALTSWLSAMQRGWTESPLAWMFLAAARREIGTAAVTEPAPTAMRLASAQVVAAAVVNQAPTATGTFLLPNPLTGAVTGTIVASDPEGGKPTITVTTKPSAGTFVYNATTSTFTYTPTAAQRITAGANPLGAGTIAMTVTVSDGVNKVPVQINIPISAIPLGVRTDVTGVNGAGAVAATNTRVYVTNRDAGTITVIDTTTAKVIGTWSVGSTPDGVAVKQDGTRLYVSSSAGNTVKVIDTATGLVKATLAVTKPTALTMSPTGASLYVASYDSAKVVRFNTSTNAVVTTTKMPTGYRPTSISASPDNTRVYVTTDTPTGGTAVLSFAPTSTTTTQVTRLAGKATSLAVSPDNGKLYVGTEDGTVSVINVSTRTVTGVFSIGGLPPVSLAVSRDGTALVVTDAAGRVGAFSTPTGTLLTAVGTHPIVDASQRPSATVSPDGTELYVTDRPSGVVHVVTLTAPNAAPVAGTPTKGTPNATTGAVTGTLGVTDPNGDPLSYTVSGAPTKGTLTLTATGGYTYTPTAAARHNASTVGAPANVTTDTFTVTVTDGRRGVVTTTVTVNISPKNAVPTITKTVGTPNTSTGVVTGGVTGTDPDGDALIYSTSVGPGKGTVTLTATGGFTYTPTAAARHAASRLGATTADKQDTFTVAVSDRHGGVVTTSVTVTVSPANAKPTGGSATVTQTDGKTGVVTGTLTAVDPDGDPLTFTSGTPQKGTLVIGANGSFTYTPTTAARDAASAPDATAASKVEALTITVSDGYGGTATFTLSAPITPYPAGNRPPVTGGATVGSSSSAIGTVTGVVTASDPDGDALTYTVVTGPKKGVLKVDAVTGAYTYTPTVDARYTALVTPGVDTDVFTVTVRDALGASTTTTVSVTIVPPAANSIDQRATSVAIHVPDLLFYSQADLDKAFDALQSVGITDLRVLVPWAAVQPVQGWNDWSAVDRVINGAAARNIKVLGVLNSTPGWAAVPNTGAFAGMPSDNLQFASFAGAAAARYKGKVTAWQVWNEPNSVLFWQPGPNAAQYTALLKAAYPAVKAADPNAVVLAAPVISVIDWFGLTVNPVRFVEEMYAAGAAGYFDALSFHPYQYTTPFSQGGYMYESPISQANRIYALMVANGDGHKKIWATEYGQPSSEVSDANQAAYIGDFLRGWRTLSYAGPSFIHTLLDRADGDPVEGSFGLFNPDWTPKTAVSTVVTVIAENGVIEAAKNATAL